MTVPVPTRPALTSARAARSLLLALVAVLAVAVAPARAQSIVSTPSDRTLYEQGPTGRYLMDGAWLFKLDPRSSGPQRETSASGWSRVSVPNAWNAGDDSVASFAGAVGWYRKDFRLPSAASALSWVVRFESANYRSRVWLNGHEVGSNRGAYLPFEVRLPASRLRPRGVNRLVVRVDSRRRATDFPPAGLSTFGTPTGGWWNYGGLLREVYLRRVDGIDFNSVNVRPDLPCRTCAATVRYHATLRNATAREQRVTVTARFGSRSFTVGVVAVPARGFASVTKLLRVGRPRLWSPASPTLYDATLTARVGDDLRQRYVVRTGVRSIKVVNGQLRLNGVGVSLRGVALHEDSRAKGFAVDNLTRRRQLAWAKELGATLIRSHMPFSPYMQERADALGLMQWSEIPVYGIKTTYLAQPLVRELAARELESNIATNGNHPSLIIWSIANELSSQPGPAQASYIAEAARRAKTLDPSRPVGIAVAGYRSAGCQPEYGPLDVIGVNDYFGWYPGPGGQIADRTFLSEYLDSVRACYPKKAIMVTEFGAEANRNGPVEEKGTYEFQQDFVNYHLGVFATKPWLSGAVYFALQEFRVRPGWEGGNPRPQPPIHQKGLVSFDGVRKPAFFDVQRWFRATAQLGPGTAVAPAPAPAG